MRRLLIILNLLENWRFVFFAFTVFLCNCIICLKILFFKKAESLYTLSGKFAEAVEMYNKAGNWAKAFKLASEFFGVEESKKLYLDKAVQLADERHFADAEEVVFSV
jgi:hypothetical protein